jgi:tetratricopeptide (TPR) repeat protein
VRHLAVLAIVILSGVILSACSPPTITPSQPPIVAGTLDTAEAYLMRGDQYSSLKDYEHAIADYTRAIQLKPDYAEAYNNRGLAEALQSKAELTNAIADYSQAIDLRPDYAYAYNNRGVAYMAGGHPNEAMQDFNQAIKLKPNFSQAHSNRGNAYYWKGQIFLALFDFFQAGKISLVLTGMLLAILLLVIVVVYFIVRRFTISRESRQDKAENDVKQKATYRLTSVSRDEEKG